MNRDNLAGLLYSFENVCFSGGADGADRLFGIWALENNHTAIHFSFNGHNHHVQDENVIVLPDCDLQNEYIKDKLRTANHKIGRKVPRYGYVYNLLARNNYQIFCTERVYTIGKLASPTLLDGGTSWAVQMYIDSTELDKEIYHYNTPDGKVYQYCNVQCEFVETDTVPAPYGRWTGIGSRSATEQDMENFKRAFV